MVWWQGCLWALAGGFVVEGLEFAAMQRRHGKWPWQIDAEVAASAGGTAAGPLGYFIAELVRLAAGGILGAALASQVTAPLPAVAIGAAAPIIAGHLTAYIPLPPTPGADPLPSSTAPAATIQDNTNGQSPPIEPPQRTRTPAPSPLPEQRETT